MDRLLQLLKFLAIWSLSCVASAFTIWWRIRIKTSFKFSIRSPWAGISNDKPRYCAESALCNRGLRILHNMTKRVRRLKVCGLNVFLRNVAEYQENQSVVIVSHCLQVVFSLSFYAIWECCKSCIIARNPEETPLFCHCTAFCREGKYLKHVRKYFFGFWKSSGTNL